MSFVDAKSGGSLAIVTMFLYVSSCYRLPRYIGSLYYVLTAIKAWICHKDHCGLWGLIIIPCPNFYCLSLPPPKLGMDKLLYRIMICGYDYLSIPYTNRRFSYPTG